MPPGISETIVQDAIAAQTVLNDAKYKQIWQTKQQSLRENFRELRSYFARIGATEQEHPELFEELIEAEALLNQWDADPGVTDAVIELRCRLIRVNSQPQYGTPAYTTYQTLENACRQIRATLATFRSPRELQAEQLPTIAPAVTILATKKGLVEAKTTAISQANTQMRILYAEIQAGYALRTSEGTTLARQKATEVNTLRQTIRALSNEKRVLEEEVKTQQVIVNDLVNDEVRRLNALAGN